MLDNSEAVIKECIALLQESGKNTKAIVLEKLRGLVESGTRRLQGHENSKR